MVKTIVILSLLVSVAHASSHQTGSKWRRVMTTDHAFSILMPANIDAEVFQKTSLKISGEKIKVRRVAGAYSNGAAFIIQIYEAKDPHRVLEDLMDIEKIRATDLSSFNYAGFPGQQQVTKYKDLYAVTQYIIIQKRLYTIEAVARDEHNPGINRFLSSLKLTPPIKLGGSNVDGTALEVAPAESDEKAIAQTSEVDVSQAVAPTRTTRKAVILYRSEPSFTEEARKRNIEGVVRLRVVLTSWGRVANIEVQKGLNGGLTERAVEAARHIKFLPAEKDGRLVSQYITIEYNFNFY